MNLAAHAGDVEFDIGQILLLLFVVVVAARLLGLAFERLRLPSVVGEIVAGIVIGNTLLFEVLHVEANFIFLELLAELGVIFLLFAVGLETRFSDLSRVGRTAIYVAILGVIIPFASGYLIMTSLASPPPEAMFIGAALVATSVGITARVIRDLRLTDTTEAKVIIGAAVIDDILGLIVLAVVSGAAGGGGFDIISVIIVAALALSFVVAIILISTKVLPLTIKPHPADAIVCSAEPKRSKVGPLSLAIIVCFGLSALASIFGLAAIIGAFLAGMVFAEYKERWPCEESFESINELMTPFFFVFVGIQVSLAAFADLGLLLFALGITVVAILTKYLGCGLGAKSLGRRSASIIGIGMSPRGEVGIIVASIGLSVGVLTESLFSVVVFMSIATTLIAPPLLVRAFQRKEAIGVESNEPR
ncbi:MAG: cation:proton antiporter [Methanomassiliicoccus sp.]|nr:cation:proton antiporter [Methanomassiliicoccus sp.]